MPIRVRVRCSVSSRKGRHKRRPSSKGRRLRRGTTLVAAPTRGAAPRWPVSWVRRTGFRRHLAGGIGVSTPGRIAPARLLWKGCVTSSRSSMSEWSTGKRRHPDDGGRVRGQWALCQDRYDRRRRRGLGCGGNQDGKLRQRASVGRLPRTTWPRDTTAKSRSGDRREMSSHGRPRTTRKSQGAPGRRVPSP